jgi:hypothetical protein
MANEEDYQNEGCERGDTRPCPPAMANSFGLQDWRLVAGRKREGNDLPAGRTDGEMRKRLLLLMLR